MNEKIHMTIAGRWQPDRDDVLDNTKVNKFSAYHHFGTNGMLQSKLLLKTARFLCHEQPQDRDHHDGFNGVKTSENGMFLYKSDQGEYIIKQRAMDYFIAGFFGAWICGLSPYAFMPAVIMSMSLPRKLAAVKYFTFHAELLPHTEQVVFHKAALFGGVNTHTVDIKNLEKIDAELL